MKKKISLERALPFVVDLTTLQEVMVGDIVDVQFDDPARPGSCHWCCGNRYRLVVTGTCIPGKQARHASGGPYEPQIYTNAIGSDIRNWSQTKFGHHRKEKWGTGEGGDTQCTITVIGHVNRFPIAELMKKPRGVPDELD